MVQAQNAEAAGNGGADILLVEDEAILAMVASEILGDAGHRVRVCDSAEEALAALDAGHRPQLAIIDHGLPGMSGAQLAEIIASRQSAPHILIASGDPAAVGGDFPSMPKPYRDDELLDRVSGLLGLSTRSGSAG